MTDHLPRPPDVSSMQPRMMTASELKENLESVFGWLQEFEAAPDPGSLEYDDETVQAIRDAANMLLSERRDRHADERAPRGG